MQLRLFSSLYNNISDQVDTLILDFTCSILKDFHFFHMNFRVKLWKSFENFDKQLANCYVTKVNPINLCNSRKKSETPPP